MIGHAEDRTPRTAVLVGRQRVHLDNVSRQGCCLKGSEPLEVGKVGILSVEIGGRMRVEFFRVTRSSLVPGSLVPGADWLYESGIEFLPIPAQSPSLHDLAAQLDESQSS